MADYSPSKWGGGGKRSVQATHSGASTPAHEPTPAEPTPEGPDATDAAKALAAEHNIDLATVSGSGVDGRITKDDVAALITLPEDDPGHEGDVGEVGASEPYTFGR
jgi:pyruvate/2-oxoglutarate dehydrogenase complex dihydrolipoamide acyltransferase (E2) component